MAELTVHSSLRVCSFLPPVQQLQFRDPQEVVRVKAAALDDRLTHCKRLPTNDLLKLLQRRLTI
ncbi:hypothetical protein EII35_03655 [Arachnia propionica]|uniref:Uncharacterized protein n=1 Tax=Arachnia propionica TaxID=1750 RepID=A0A3P1WVA0_9ACTN|nr:hypothetical protein EII35_03655 [Arachnia propionica]